jgi:hypothetical protein
MVRSCDLKFKCTVNNYKVLTKDKIYTCEEESTLYPGVYFVRGNNNAVISVSRGDWGIVFLDELRDEKIEEILK